MEGQEENNDIDFQKKKKDQCGSPVNNVLVPMEDQSNQIDENEALKLLEDMKQEYLGSQNQELQQKVIKPKAISSNGDKSVETLVEGVESKDSSENNSNIYNRDIFRDHLCNLCHFRTQHYRNLLRHQQVHKVPVFQCSLCEKKFSNQTKQRRHENSAHAKVIGRDSYLNDDFLSPPLDNVQDSELQSLLEVKHPEVGKEKEENMSKLEEPIYQDNAELSEADDQAKHIPSSEGFSESKICKVCGRIFANSKNMKKHVKSTHNGLKETCPHCKASFSQSWILKNHINVKHA